MIKCVIFCMACCRSICVGINKQMLFYRTLNSFPPRSKWPPFWEKTFSNDLLEWNDRNAIQICLKLVPSGPVNNIEALIRIMAWRRPGDKPLSKPMMVSLPTHICVTWPQWVNRFVQVALCRYRIGFHSFSNLMLHRYAIPKWLMGYTAFCYIWPLKYITKSS